MAQKSTIHSSLLPVAALYRKILKRPGLRQADYARLCGFSRLQVSRACRALEAAGFVERLHNRYVDRLLRDHLEGEDES